MLFYWISCLLGFYAQHNKRKNAGQNQRLNSVQNKYSCAGKQQYILYSEIAADLGIVVGEGWQAFPHKKLANSITDFINLGGGGKGWRRINGTPHTVQSNRKTMCFSCHLSYDPNRHLLPISGHSMIT